MVCGHSRFPLWEVVRNNFQLGQGRDVHPAFFLFYWMGLNFTQRLHIIIGLCSVVMTLTFRFMRKFTHLLSSLIQMSNIMTIKKFWSMYLVVFDNLPPSVIPQLFFWYILDSFLLLIHLFFVWQNGGKKS